jgi:hypothetical protein
MFREIATHGQRILFTELPEHFGFDQPPWWITTVLRLGATVVFLAHKLPGQAGEGPSTLFTLMKHRSKQQEFGSLLSGH